MVKSHSYVPANIDRSSTLHRFSEQLSTIATLGALDSRNSSAALEIRSCRPIPPFLALVLTHLGSHSLMYTYCKWGLDNLRKTLLAFDRVENRAHLKISHSNSVYSLLIKKDCAFIPPSLSTLLCFVLLTASESFNVKVGSLPSRS